MPSSRSARRAAGPDPSGAVGAAVYSKLVAFAQLLDSDIRKIRTQELQRYFPTPLQKKYADAMERHRLKREIIATAVTNQTINRMGATFLMRMQEDTGRSIAEVAKATPSAVKRWMHARCGRRSMPSTARCRSRCRSTPWK